jgi:hypothetical protein
MRNFWAVAIKLAIDHVTSVAWVMDVTLERELLSTVDRIYESVERPELWPETIHVIGETLGGRRGF